MARLPTAAPFTAVLLTTALLAAILPGNTAAQEPPSASDPTSAAGAEWNDPTVLELVERGRAARQDQGADPSLEAYRALATGHVYFLLDRPGGEGRSLIKADQVAVEVYWQEPGLSRQVIVGRRDEMHLPTNIRYHLDHLTVVTDDFDDRITLGQGDEVRAAIHPLAPGSETAYDFRMGDSLSLSYPGRDGSIRVQEIRVRPRDRGRPGVVGSVFLDRETAGVVRMGLTFTPASYVDPNLDQIQITLDNSLWLGRHWLPYRQQIEIRRELPYLAAPTGTVIQARFRVGDYRFNQPRPLEFFQGPRIDIRPEAELEAYSFGEDLYAPIEEEGLAPAPDMETVRRQALQLLAEERLSGLPALRPWIPSASQVVRHNRAEGLFFGAGLRLDPSESFSAEASGGYAIGREAGSARLELDGGSLRPGSGLEGRWNVLQDAGTLPGASGALSSLSSLVRGRDYVDPYFVSGIRLFHRLEREGLPWLAVQARVEDHESGRIVVGDPGDRRPLPDVEEGAMAALDLEAATGPPGGSGGWSLAGGVTLAQFEGRVFAEGRARIGLKRAWLDHGIEATADLQGAVLDGSPPDQLQYRLGGRGTLPGYGYRELEGDRYWLLQTRARWDPAGPWLSPEIFASVGEARGPNESPDHGPRVSVGIGAALLWNAIHIDAGYGVESGHWEWVLSVDRSFWPIL